MELRPARGRAARLAVEEVLQLAQIVRGNGQRRVQRERGARVVAAERARAQKVEEVKKTLHAGGVDISCIPQHELAAGHGEMIDAELDWMRRLEASRGTPRHDALVDLLAKIENWRDERAQQLGRAPAAVLSASLCKKIAYSQPRSVEALRAVGVRVTGVETLSDIIAAAAPTAEPTPEASGGATVS